MYEHAEVSMGFQETLRNPPTFILNQLKANVFEHESHMHGYVNEINEKLKNKMCGKVRRQE